MAFSWDWVIAVFIIVGLILAIWAKVSQQTIMELLRDIRDTVQEKRDGDLHPEGLVYYE